MPVAGPVHMLAGGGGNIGVVADPAGLLMMDAMEEPAAAGIRAAIRSWTRGFLSTPQWLEMEFRTLEKQKQP